MRGQLPGVKVTIFLLPDAQLTPEQQLRSPGQLLRLNTEHNVTWYKISCLASLGQPSWLCPLPDSCEN